MARRPPTPPYATKVIGLSFHSFMSATLTTSASLICPRQVDMLNDPLPITAAFHPGFLIESHDTWRMSAALGSVNRLTFWHTFVESSYEMMPAWGPLTALGGACSPQAANSTTGAALTIRRRCIGVLLERRDAR